jgi:hypothetical protein
MLPREISHATDRPKDIFMAVAPKLRIREFFMLRTVRGCESREE